MKKSDLHFLIKESIKEILRINRADSAIIFFLPTSTRPIDYQPLPSLAHNWKFWHVGIIYKDMVYECFNGSKYSITKFKSKIKEFINMKAVFVKCEIDLNKLKSELISGTSCSEYVARVVGLSHTTGSIKQYSPDSVYQFL